MSKKIRPFGEILLEMETLIDEAIDDHGVQAGDILNQVNGHIQSHRRDAIEECVDGTKFRFYYGPEEES